MPNNLQLADLKNKIKSSARRCSDRGFLPYGGCNQVCSEMLSVMRIADCYIQDAEYQKAFDIYIMVLLEAMKLLLHADTSSGAAGDVIHCCITDIDQICNVICEEKSKHFFDTIIKTAKNKVFKDWPDDGYRLLKSAVHLVQNHRQALKIYEVFPSLDELYGQDDPTKLLITFGIIERLEGKEAADKYLTDNIHVPELRMIVVENAIATEHYLLAEELCVEMLKKGGRGYFNNADPRAYYLERVYAKIADEEKRTELLQVILLHGDTSYFKKLKELYQRQGVWEQKKEPLLRELSEALMAHVYAALLAREGEAALLLDVIKQHKAYIMDYGKQLVENYPQEAHEIYEEYILEEAERATDRRKYRNVCRIIKNFSKASAKVSAMNIIDRLSNIYQRRPAMIEELVALKEKMMVLCVLWVW